MSNSLWHFLFLAKAEGIYAVTLACICVCVCDALVNMITGEPKCLQSSNLTYRLPIWGKEPYCIWCYYMAPPMSYLLGGLPIVSTWSLLLLVEASA